MLTGIEIIGLVASIITLVTFSGQLIHIAGALQDGSTFSTTSWPGRLSIETAAKVIEAHIATISHLGRSKSGVRRQLSRLAEDCIELGLQMLALLSKIKHNNRSRTSQSLLTSVKQLLEKSHMRRLEKKPGRYRELIKLEIMLLMRDWENKILADMPGQGNHKRLLAKLKKIDGIDLDGTMAHAQIWYLTHIQDKAIGKSNLSNILKGLQ